ncbi:MAG: anthranilate synthase component I [Candidatus Omnitrophica bacterium]|nr:anthranilate synthase component I [Candidatus Omnitrophota bacterium]
MIPSLTEFIELTKKGNVIPVYKEIKADLDTPVSAFIKIARGRYSFLFESVEGEEKVGRYSFLGTEPAFVFESRGEDIVIRTPGKDRPRRYRASGGPYEEIRKLMSGFRAVEVEGVPRFSGGLLGYMSYDMIRFFERIPDGNPDRLDCPDCLMMLTDSLLVFDHFKHRIKIVSNCILPSRGRLTRKAAARLYRSAQRKILRLEKNFLKNIPAQAHYENEAPSPVNVRSNFTMEAYQAVVRRAKKHIRKGDIIQVVPSQRFTVPTRKKPLAVYRALRSLNPSPYMFYLELGDMALVGSSPEMLVRCENGLVQTRPIAGTRSRGRNASEDDQLARELKRDTKERAEHLMLVDLGRNDLGRVCKTGSVTVSEFMKIEKYSHVMHLVSEVSGKLDKKRFDIYDVLQAAFPAGTVSGSPKIRAMEIIDDLETVRRGPYAGCVGYFSFSQNMDTCITIRTVVMKKDTAYVQAGGGIVADSRPVKEYQESVNKARALIEAIKKA